MNFETLQVTVEDSLATVVVNRPKVLNALNKQVLMELMQVFTQLQQKPGEIKGVMLTGTGDKAFVAGADIAAMKEMTALDADDFCALGHCVMRMIEASGFPVIAAVNGFALGGGLELALSCDFIYASNNAKLGLPEVNLGLFPGFGGTQRLARLVGRGRAKELVYTADMIDASEALRIGLVNKVTEPGDLLIEAKKTLQKIAGKGPLAVKFAKKVINEGTDLPLASGLVLEQTQFPIIFATEDRNEGVSAFLEKRKPEFKSK